MLTAAVSTSLEMAGGKSPEHIFGVRVCLMCIVTVDADYNNRTNKIKMKSHSNGTISLLQETVNTSKATE